jgi:glycosyltransferase involved in cell wall biosynthesis
MNIAFFGNFYPDAVDGVSVVCYALAKALTEHGHQVYFYFNADKSSTQIDVPSGIVRRGFHKKKLLPLSPELANFLVRNPDKIAVFHIHSVFYPPNTAFAFALSRLGYPYVLSPHGGYNDNIFKRHWFKKMFYYYFFEKRMVRQAKAIFCVAEREKEDLKRFDYQGIVRVVPNIITTSPSAVEATKILPDEDLPKTILFLGRYDMLHKGLDNLLHIFKHIEKIDKNIVLKLYGKGNDKAKLKKMVSSLRLHNVSIHDGIFGKEKEEVMRKATAYIQPSRWEAFGMALFEAAMLGVPVIINKNLYMSDFFVQHQLGLLIDDNFEESAKMIVDFIHNESLRKRISQKIGHIVEATFAPAHIAELASEIYSQYVE